MSSKFSLRSESDNPASSSALLERLNVPPELKSIFQQRQVGHVGGGPLGFDFGDDGCKFAALHGIAHAGFEALHTMYRGYARYSGSAGDPFQVCSCTGCG